MIFTFLISSQLSLLLVILLCFFVLVNFYLGLLSNKIFHKYYDEKTKTGRFVDYLSNTMTNYQQLKEIKVFNLRNWFLKKYSKKLNELNILSFKEINFNMWLDIIRSILFLLQDGIVFVYLSYNVVYNNLTIADYTLYLASATQFIGLFQNIINEFVEYKKQNIYLNNFRNFVEINLNPSQQCMEEQNYEIEEIDIIEFINVSFQYPNTKKYAIKNFSLIIRKNERLALVGKNGAGKTTIMKLLIGLYKPSEGKILINNQDLNKYSMEVRMKIFSVVFQDSVLFPMSISQNISMQEMADNKLLQSSLIKSDLSNLVGNLKKGANTQLYKVIDEEGIHLSGGENQKILIARSFYNDAPIKIFDEPTAAIDAIAELCLFEKINESITDKIALFISHRLSSIKFCDKIIVLEEGTIIEEGTHKQLMTLKGVYSEMFNKQSEYYI